MPHEGQPPTTSCPPIVGRNAERLDGCPECGSGSNLRTVAEGHRRRSIERHTVKRITLFEFLQSIHWRSI